MQTSTTQDAPGSGYMQEPGGRAHTKAEELQLPHTAAGCEYPSGRWIGFLQALPQLSSVPGSRGNGLAGGGGECRGWAPPRRSTPGARKPLLSPSSSSVHPGGRQAHPGPYGHPPLLCKDCAPRPPGDAQAPGGTGPHLRKSADRPRRTWAEQDASNGSPIIRQNHCDDELRSQSREPLSLTLLLTIFRSRGEARGCPPAPRWRDRGGGDAGAP